MLGVHEDTVTQNFYLFLDTKVIYYMVEKKIFKLDLKTNMIYIDVAEVTHPFDDAQNQRRYNTGVRSQSALARSKTQSVFATLWKKTGTGHLMLTITKFDIDADPKLSHTTIQYPKNTNYAYMVKAVFLKEKLLAHFATTRRFLRLLLLDPATLEVHDAFEVDDRSKLMAQNCDEVFASNGVEYILVNLAQCPNSADPKAAELMLVAVKKSRFHQVTLSCKVDLKKLQFLKGVKSQGRGNFLELEYAYSYKLGVCRKLRINFKH